MKAAYFGSFGLKLGATLPLVNRFRKLGQSLGLIHHEDGQPQRSKHSRYMRGYLVSPRLDEDVDDLRRRLAELERRLSDGG